MNPLIEVMRKAEAGRLPAAPADIVQPREPAALELAPLAAHVILPPPPEPLPEQPTAGFPTAGSGGLPGRPFAPTRWRSFAAAGAAGFLAAITWWALAPDAGPIRLAHADPRQAALPAPPQPVAASEPEPPATPPMATPPATATPRSRPATSGTSPARTDPTVRFLRTPRQASSPRAATSEAHDAYAAGDLASARQHYRRALADDPHDADALGGLGAVALREARTTEADILFRHALLARPDDPLATAGLARLHAASAQQAESRLRLGLASRPDGAENLALRVTLADTLARQQRWAEAQQAWFQAHSLAPDDADITYNLAVSLDHLGQQRLAAGFYREALQLARQQPAARLPRERCEARLQALAPGP